LPPGLSFNAISAKALAASKNAKLPRSYWDWGEMLANNVSGFFPYTPATNLLYGLHEALDMLFAEGLDRVFARHTRLAEATRRAGRRRDGPGARRGPVSQGRRAGRNGLPRGDGVGRACPRGVTRPGFRTNEHTTGGEER